jgi:predicted nucleic acid-binding protein
VSFCVLDASVVFAWCFVDEASPAADALLDRIAAEGAVVPSVWSLEIADVLLVAERRRRIDATASTRFVDMLARLPIAVDDETVHRALGDTIQLARAIKLAAHDAAYLELARRRALPIATRDEAMRRAAQALRIRLLKG